MADYQQLVRQEAQRQGVDPNLAGQVLQNETGGEQDPATARSSAGAIGPMQLMPDTAKDLGVDPSDPNQNIRGGVSYLKQLSSQFESPDQILAAYNAGPGATRRSLDQSGQLPQNRETQDYVARGQNGMAQHPMAQQRDQRQGQRMSMDDVRNYDGGGQPQSQQSGGQRMSMEDIRQYDQSSGQETVDDSQSPSQSSEESEGFDWGSLSPVRDGKVEPFLGNIMQSGARTVDALSKYAATPAVNAASRAIGLDYREKPTNATEWAEEHTQDPDNIASQAAGWAGQGAGEGLQAIAPGGLVGRSLQKGGQALEGVRGAEGLGNFARATGQMTERGTRPTAANLAGASGASVGAEGVGQASDNLESPVLRSALRGVGGIAGGTLAGGPLAASEDINSIRSNVQTAPKGSRLDTPEGQATETAEREGVQIPLSLRNDSASRVNRAANWASLFGAARQRNALEDTDEGLLRLINERGNVEEPPLGGGDSPRIRNNNRVAQGLRDEEQRRRREEVNPLFDQLRRAEAGAGVDEPSTDLKLPRSSELIKQRFDQLPGYVRNYLGRGTDSQILRGVRAMGESADMADAGKGGEALSPEQIRKARGSIQRAGRQAEADLQQGNPSGARETRALTDDLSDALTEDLREYYHSRGLAHLPNLLDEANKTFAERIGRPYMDNTARARITQSREGSDEAQDAAFDQLINPINNKPEATRATMEAMSPDGQAAAIDEVLRRYGAMASRDEAQTIRPEEDPNTRTIMSFADPERVKHLTDIQNLAQLRQAARSQISRTENSPLAVAPGVALGYFSPGAGAAAPLAQRAISGAANQADWRLRNFPTSQGGEASQALPMAIGAGSSRGLLPLLLDREQENSDN